jgi:hypothetical protein
LSNEIIAEYVNNAEEKLKTALILLKNDRFDDVVSRAYYAVFHCAQALLASIGVKAETHTGVRSLFGFHFIKTKKMAKIYSRYLKNLKDDREVGDYGIYSLIDEADAKNAIIEAQEFLKETKRLLGVLR